MSENTDTLQEEQLTPEEEAQSEAAEELQSEVPVTKEKRLPLFLRRLAKDINPTPPEPTSLTAEEKSKQKQEQSLKYWETIKNAAEERFTGTKYDETTQSMKPAIINGFGIDVGPLKPDDNEKPAPQPKEPSLLKKLSDAKEASIYIKWVQEGANPYLLNIDPEMRKMVIEELIEKYGYENMFFVHLKEIADRKKPNSPPVSPYIIPPTPSSKKERHASPREVLSPQRKKELKIEEQKKERKKIPSPQEIIDRINQNLLNKELELYIKWTQEGANPYAIPMTKEFQDKFIEKLLNEHVYNQAELDQKKSEWESKKNADLATTNSTNDNSDDQEKNQNTKNEENIEEKKRKFLHPVEIRKHIHESLKNQEAELYINWILNGTNPYLIKMRANISDIVFGKLKNELGYTDLDLSRLKRESIRPKARLVLPFTESNLPEESEMQTSNPQESKEEPEDRLKQVNETFRNLEAAYFIKWVLEGANPYLLSMTTEVTEIVMRELKNKYGYDDEKLKNLEIQARLFKKIQT